MLSSLAVGALQACSSREPVGRDHEDVTFVREEGEERVALVTDGSDDGRHAHGACHAARLRAKTRNQVDA